MNPTDAVRTMVRDWLGTATPTPEQIEETARWMRDSLRLGGLRHCRNLIRAALAPEPEARS